MAKNERRRPAIDPAVQAGLGKDGIYGKLARERGMTAAQRKRAKADRERSRMTVDVPQDLQDVMEKIAQAEGLPKSQVVSWLLVIGLAHLDRGAIIDARVPSKSMRWEFTLDLPEVVVPEDYR